MSLQLDLISHPSETILYFFKNIYSIINKNINYLNYFLFTSAFIFTYFSLTNYLNILSYLNFQIINISYWFILGVMSSIGLGFGVHTGFLILFPLVSKVAILSSECNSTNFEIYGDDAFNCIPGNEQPKTFQIYSKIFTESFFWAVGTACGEVPPYWISRFDRLNRSSSFDFTNFTNSRIMNFLNKVTIDLLLKFRFWAILFLSSYPNAAFDLCGIAAGHYLIPFREFISATIIGKAFIKTPMQCYLLIRLFTSDVIEKTILKLPDFISHIILELVNGYKLKLSKPEEVENEFGILTVISFLWNSVIVLLVLYFFKSIIDTMANNEKNKIK